MLYVGILRITDGKTCWRCFNLSRYRSRTKTSEWNVTMWKRKIHLTESCYPDLPPNGAEMMPYVGIMRIIEHAASGRRLVDYDDVESLLALAVVLRNLKKCLWPRAYCVRECTVLWVGVSCVLSECKVVFRVSVYIRVLSVSVYGSEV